MTTFTTCLRYCLDKTFGQNIKQSFTASDQFNLTTDMCEVLGLCLPLSKTAKVTFYRPPNCEIGDFTQALESTKFWLSSLESKYSITPTIILNRDFNFPKMKSWIES